MSGAWSKGTNRAVATPPSSLQAAAANGGRRLAPNGGGAGRTGGRGSRGGGRGGATAGGTGNGTGGGWNNRDDRDRERGGGRGGGRGSSGRGGGGGHRDGGNGFRDRDGGGGRGGGRRGGGGGSHHGDRRNGRSQRGGGGGRSTRIIVKDARLLENGDGDTAQQRAVQRVSSKLFMNLRLKYLDAPDDFKPHAQCHWTAEERELELKLMSSKAIELGDVSKVQKKKAETAPPLEDCKPLEVNDETRWKPKQQQGEDDAPKGDTIEETLAKALLILNKISWTTLERLTTKFIEDTKLMENDEAREACLGMLIHKSQTEHHFGPMYAQLCASISEQFNPFKRELLAKCQEEFEIDINQKISETTEGIKDPDEIEYHSSLIRKAFIGHIKFIGELYKRDTVKLRSVMYCLDVLLSDESSDDNLECFAHMMTTMGEKLDQHALLNNKPFDWEKVELIRTSGSITNRTKFLLQDLLELRDRGWVKRRKEETAKTIDQIHKEVAKEEAMGSRRRSSTTTSVSGGSLRRSTSLASAVQAADPDGFQAVKRTSMKRVSSKGDVMGSLGPLSKSALQSMHPSLKRSQSQPTKMTSMSPGSPLGRKSIVVPGPAVPDKSSKLSPAESGEKMKRICKEYFVAGDTADAVLSVHEVVQNGEDGSVERGAKMIEAACLLVMEMKEVEVNKLVTLLEKCVEDSKLPDESIVTGFADPLEFLSDIEIDAPLAGSHLATIIAKFISMDKLSLTVLKEAPEYFLTDGKPAKFAAKVLKKRGGDPSEDEIKVVEELMTDDDRNTHQTAAKLIAE